MPEFTRNSGHTGTHQAPKAIPTLKAGSEMLKVRIPSPQQATPKFRGMDGGGSSGHKMSQEAPGRPGVLRLEQYLCRYSYKREALHAISSRLATVTRAPGRVPREPGRHHNPLPPKLAFSKTSAQPSDSHVSASACQGPSTSAEVKQRGRSPKARRRSPAPAQPHASERPAPQGRDGG